MDAPRLWRELMKFDVGENFTSTKKKTKCQELILPANSESLREESSYYKDPGSEDPESRDYFKVYWS